MDVLDHKYYYDPIEFRMLLMLYLYNILHHTSHKNFLRLARCEELAQRKGCSVAQIALGWMFTQGLNLYTAAATTKPERILSNLKALEIDFTQEEIAYLSEV